MSDSDRPPLVRLTWPVVFAFVLVDVILTSAIIAMVVSYASGAPPAAVAGSASHPRRSRRPSHGVEPRRPGRLHVQLLEERQAHFLLR